MKGKDDELFEVWVWTSPEDSDATAPLKSGSATGGAATLRRLDPPPAREAPQPRRRAAASRAPRAPGQRPAAFDRRPALRQHVGGSGGGIDRRRHRRGDHRDAVAGPRLHRHRPELGLCLQGPVGRRPRDRPRSRRPLRARRQPAQVRRPRPGDGAADRRRERRRISGPTATTACSRTCSISRTRSPRASPARCARRSGMPRSPSPAASGRKTSPPTTSCCAPCRTSGRTASEDNAEAIKLLDEAMQLDPGYARATAIAAWARAQHVVYNWTDDIEAIRAEGERLIAARLACGRRRPDRTLRAVDGDHAPLRRPRARAALRRAGAGARSRTTPGPGPGTASFRPIAASRRRR